MRFFIDNKEADIDHNESVSISLSIASVTNIEMGRTGYSKAFRVPATQHNISIVGDIAEIHSIEMFNRQGHTARIEVNGCMVIEGLAMMSKFEKSGNGGWYVFNIIGPGREWIKVASENMLRTLPIPYSETISAGTVAVSWTNDSPVKYFPVQHDTLSIMSANFQGSTRLLTFRDYHPFIRVKNIIDTIAAQAGYKISSRFMDSEMFGSLYMSGKYPERNVDDKVETMGFKAGRRAAATATADRFGRVYANPWLTSNTLGNIVDTAVASEVSDGSLGIYNNNDAFGYSGNIICFTPVESINVGFEYHLRYHSDYRILNRSELKCFDRVYLEDKVEHRFRVTNPNVDRRDTFEDGWQYTAMIFDHVDGTSYKLTCRYTGSSTSVTLNTFSARSAGVTVNTGRMVENPQLWVLQSGGSYVLYAGDWALYDGHVAETGVMDIDLKVRSMAGTVTPSLPRHFDQIYFGCGEQGMQMTLSDKVTLKPIFMAHPGNGDTVSFELIAAHEIKQIEVLNALKHMFNLYFYTDSLSKTIYIEPREQFYESLIVDWSDKADLSEPIVIEEMGAQMHEQLVFRYQEGDGSVARWDEANRQVMGAWSTTINNLFAKSGVKTYRNPLFTPTINKTGEYLDAREASIIQVGDRARGGIKNDSENLNFPPKIVRFEGMKTLGSGNWWGWPSYTAEYPKVGFHNPGNEAYTLCFENRDGITGLHSYYDRNIAAYNTGRRITVYLDLRAWDIEPFIIPNSLKKDFRALFRLKIDGETVYCRLEEIVDYNPARKGPTKCIFIKY